MERGLKPAYLRRSITGGDRWNGNGRECLREMVAMGDIGLSDDIQEVFVGGDKIQTVAGLTEVNSLCPSLRNFSSEAQITGQPSSLKCQQFF